MGADDPANEVDRRPVLADFPWQSYLQDEEDPGDEDMELEDEL